MSVDFIKYVIDLPYARQLGHWGTRDPWRHGGSLVRFPVGDRVEPKHLQLREGNVIDIAKDVIRPCFGSPTAFLMHGGGRIKWKGKQAYPDRCSICPARSACEIIAKQRLRPPSISAAVADWEDVGGRDAHRSSQNRGRASAATHRWRDLIRALERQGPFENANDTAIRAWVDAKLEKRSMADKERLQAKRAQVRAERDALGQFDDAFLSRVEHEALYRRFLFIEALKLPCSPSWISQADATTPVLTSRVWQAKILLLAAQRSINPSSVATEMIDRGLTDSTNQNALRDSARRALKRIERLETVVLKGSSEPVWPVASVADMLENPVARWP